MADPESGELIHLKDLKGKLVFESFKKDVLPKAYYIKVGIMFFLSLFFIFIFYHLKGISQSIIDKEPFHQQNQKRLQSIGFALIILAFLGPLLKTIFNYHFPIDTTCLTVNSSNTFNLIGIDWTYLVIGLGTLFLAEVFKAGNELKEETELTI